MNDYMKGYEGIQNKLYEKEVERMNEYAKEQTEQKKELELQKIKQLKQR